MPINCFSQKQQDASPDGRNRGFNCSGVLYRLGGVTRKLIVTLVILSSIVPAPVVQPAMIFKQIRMEGFVVSRWRDRFPETIDQMHAWLKEVML